jgi:hypothetical protein
MTTPRPDSPELRAQLAQLAAMRIVKFREDRAALTDAIATSLRLAAGWGEADARALAAQVAAEALSWTPARLLDQMSAHLNASNGMARDIEEAEIGTHQRWLRARRKAEKREDEREAREATAADTTSADQIEMKRVRWLWQEEGGQYQPQIPLAEVTIGAGREGVAKTQWTHWTAARVTRGTLPGELEGKPRNVIICAREDSWEHTIKPRLVAAGADTCKVFRVQVRNVASGKSVNLQLPTDNGLLESEIVRLDAALVIFDPLLSALDARLNSHRASDVRAALEPLADIAHGTGASMIGLAHFTKMEGRDAASLIGDSHAFKDVARAIIVFARDSEATGC